MRKFLVAMLAGAVLAVPFAFVLAAVFGAVFGASEPWGEVAHGWQGAQNGVSSLVFLSATFPPTLPAVALAGAALGVIVWAIRRATVSR